MLWYLWFIDVFPNTDKLGKESNKCCNPGGLLALLKGEPGVPTKDIVEQEGTEQKAGPLGLTIHIELCGQSDVAVNVHSWKGHLEGTNEKSLLYRVGIFHSTAYVLSMTKLIPPTITVINKCKVHFCHIGT